MVSEKAKHKARVLGFWQRHGLAAAVEAFGIKRRRLYGWKAQFLKGKGKLEALNEQSKAPHRRRQRQWPKPVVEESGRLRESYPNLGKEKLYILLKPFCDRHALVLPRPRTIGRIIADAAGERRAAPMKVNSRGKKVVRSKVQRPTKPKGFTADYPGHCGAFDSVERFVEGYRRYVISFTDLYSRFGFAWATKSHGSLAAREFFGIVREVFPYPLHYALTDNGCEFMKHFDEELRRLHKVHWHTYPKTPKMNAHVERFNRTLAEEFLDYHQELLIEPQEFNRPLVPWLLWYNAERPHWSLGLKSPIQFLMEKYPKECNMWWPSTAG